MKAIQPTEAVEVYRKFDLIVIPIVFFLLVGAFHLHSMLTVGDWDFWTDWKDRRWWVVVTPIALITFPAALQAILWEKFRIPFAATVTILGLVFGQWMNRVINFVGWTYFPLNFVWPATLIPCALVLDAVLLLTRSYLLTAILGGTLWGLLFYPANWTMLAPFHAPVDYNGVLMSLADIQGFEYIRTGTPEYIRIIERGTLRTFEGDVTPISAFFSAFVCSLMYYLWHFMGRWFSTTRYVKNP